MIATDAKPLADLVRQMRGERSWSQEHLAAASGVSVRTVQRIENGFPPAAETLQALAAAFDIEVSALAASQPLAANGARLGLTPAQAGWVGLILCMPTALYVAINVGYYGFQQHWLASMLARGIAGAVWGSPFVLLGFPLLALVFNAPHVFSLRARAVEEGAWINGVLIRWSWPQSTAFVIAVGLIALVFAYAVSEGISEMIRDAVSRAR